MAQNTLDRLFAFLVHADGQECLTEPAGSKVFLEPSNPVVFRPSPQYTPATRAGRTKDEGQVLPDARGVQNTALPGLNFEVSGLTGGGAGDGVDADGIRPVLDTMLSQFFGGVRNATGGLSHDSAAGTGTGLEMDATALESLVATCGVLVKGTTSGSYQAREIVSGSNPSYVMDRALTDNTGAADTPEEAEVVYGSRAYWLRQLLATGTRSFAFFDERENDEFEALGCFPSSVAFGMGPGQIMQMNLGGFTSAKWNTTLTSGSMTYSAPTVGLPIICSPLILHIGSVRYMAWDFAFDLNMRVAQKKGPGPNNVLGHHRLSLTPSLTCKVLRGDFTAPTELTRALQESLQGSTKESVTTQDISLQIGDTPGGCAMVRMPKGRMTVEGESEEDGMDLVSLKFMCTEDASSTNGPLRVHFF